MADVARAVIAEIGLDRTTFNVEFFWDDGTDRLVILEVNPRHSQSHAPLFDHVDGLANHQVMLDLALGREPQMRSGEGAFGCAAKWFLRRFEDGVVTRVPTEAEVAAIEADEPGTTIVVEVDKGDRLSELHDQDSYSYKLAHLFVGGADPDELTARYERCVARLHFDFDEP
jgi:biotin carboxylase